MADKKDNKNWQLRQYDNFGPHFRIDTGNPEVGEDGATVWGFYGEDPDTKARCTLRQSSTGFFHLYNDGNIEIIGGHGEEGSVANKEGNTVDVLIHGASDGGQIALKVKGDGSILISGGKHIVMTARDIDINAGKDINMNADKITFNSTTLTYTDKAIKGKIPPTIGDRICKNTYVDAIPDGELPSSFNIA